MGFMLLALLGIAASSFVFFDGSDDAPETGPCDHGDDTINGVEGDPGDNDLLADGSDTAVGGAGEDTIRLNDTAFGWGGTGDDTILARDESTAYGGDGNDFLSVSGDATGFGGCGDDDLTLRSGGTGFGGEGNDSFTLIGGGTEAFGDAGDDVFDAFGSSTSHGGDGNDAFDLDGATGLGGAGDDVMLARYYALAEGGDGNDSLSARHGSDIFGNAGDDWLEVFGEDEQAVGGDGNDTLTVEDTTLHSDATLTGGAGEDSFILSFEGDPEDPGYANNGNGLHITDFSPTEDTIVIEGAEPTTIEALADGDTGTELQLTFADGTVQSVFLENITPDAIDTDGIIIETQEPVAGTGATVTPLDDGSYQIALGENETGRLLVVVNTGTYDTGENYDPTDEGYDESLGQDIYAENHTMMVLLVPSDTESPLDISGTDYWTKFDGENMGSWFEYMDAQVLLQVDLDAFRMGEDDTSLPQLVTDEPIEFIETTSLYGDAEFDFNGPLLTGTTSLQPAST